MQPLRFTILGQAASKANSRMLVTSKQTGRTMSIKSPEARKFMKDALRQIPPTCRVRLQGPVAVLLHMHYASERPDLDESIVLDALQDQWGRVQARSERLLLQPGVYCNDRQVRWKLVIHHIDVKNPRVEVAVRSIAPTEDMFSDLPADADLPF